MENPELYQMCMAHFNEPMIFGFDLVRCVGYGETAVDCYIIAQTPGNQYPKSDGLVWITCVGGYTWLNRLKGQGYVKSTNGEDWDDFTRLDSSLELNGAPKHPEFLLDFRPDDHEDWMNKFRRVTRRPPA